MDKEIKRLEPKPNTIKNLFAKSGNMCAFPGCHNAIVNSHGVVVGEICHIVAAEKGGKRFINNEEWTNEKRRSIENLILLCPEHHKEIDADENTYTIEVLQEYKKQHETNFNPDKIFKDLEKNFKNNISNSFKYQNKILNRIDTTTNSIDNKIDLIIRTLTSSFDMNLQDYINYVEHEISDKTIKELHSALMKEYYPAYLLGIYRNVDAWIGPRGCNKKDSILQTVEPENIEKELLQLLKKWNQFIKKGANVDFEKQCVELAKFHIRFLQIHPFYDGNGRVSRAILISQIHMLRGEWVLNTFINKLEYYSAIKNADKNDLKNLITIIRKSIENN